MQPGSAPHSDTAVSPLPYVVKQYKRLYYGLLGIAGLLLLCVIAYIILWKQETGHSYLPLDRNTQLRKTMAVDSSGKMIATVIYNSSDSTTGIIVSEDGGKHFQQWGGPWKTNLNEGSSINHIYIASDSKSIVAVGFNSLYIKAAGSDSFIIVRNLISNVYNAVLSGVAFSNISDSAYAYSTDSVYAFRYTKCDSIGTGYFENMTNISELKAGKYSNTFAGIIKRISDPGVFVNYNLLRTQIFPVSYFNSKPLLYSGTIETFDDFAGKPVKGVLTNQYATDSLSVASPSKNQVKQ